MLRDLLVKFLTICKVEYGLAKLTVDAYKSDLDDFLLFVKEDKNITKQLMCKYLENLYNRQFKRSSYLRKLSSINQFIKFLINENIIIDNPMIEIKRPKKEKKIPKFLKEDEINLLVKVAGTNDKFGIRISLIIEFLYSSGMRISELLTLKVSDIKRNDSLILIKGKGNKERLVPINKKTFELLDQYLKVRQDFLNKKNDNKYLFPSRNKTGHLTRELVGIELKKVAKLTNIDESRISPHILRHSFATKLCNKKVNLRVIQELLGHSDISTTEIYIETMDEEIVEFLNKNHPLSLK